MSETGSLSIIELFLGSVAGLLPGLVPGSGTTPAPKLDVQLGSGDITVEGLQGLKSPEDAAHMQSLLLWRRPRRRRLDP